MGEQLQLWTEAEPPDVHPIGADPLGRLSGSSSTRDKAERLARPWSTASQRAEPWHIVEGAVAPTRAAISALKLELSPPKVATRVAGRQKQEKKGNKEAGPSSTGARVKPKLPWRMHHHPSVHLPPPVCV